MADKIDTVFGTPEPFKPGVESRVPPHDMDAEAACLSAMLNDKLALDKVAEVLKPEHFYSEAHRRICEGCYALSAGGTQPDIVTVATWLREQDRLAQVGGFPYLTTVSNGAPALSNVVAYATTVLECWKARQLILLTHRYQAAGYGGYGAEYGSASGMINAAAQDLFELESQSDRSKVEHIGPIMGVVFEKVQAANARGRNITGLSTGFDTYDRITSGLHPGELTVVAARPGMGKTSLVTGMLTNVTDAPPEGWPAYDPDDEETWQPAVILFSLEMPKEQIVQRMMCSHARVEMAKLRTNQLTKTDWEKLTNAASDLHARGIFVDDEPALTPMEFRAKVRRKTAEAKRPADGKPKRRVVLVGVDYMQLMKGDGDHASREQEIASISRALKVTAKELGIPVIGLAQLNRAVETRGGDKGKRPQLSDLRESGAIEQDADNICFIYRDDYYNKETADRNVAELIIAKQRNGPTDTVRLRWDGMFTRFDNLAEGEYEGYAA